MIVIFYCDNTEVDHNRDLTDVEVKRIMTSIKRGCKTITCPFCGHRIIVTFETKKQSKDSDYYYKPGTTLFTS